MYAYEEWQATAQDKHGEQAVRSREAEKPREGKGGGRSGKGGVFDFPFSLLITQDRSNKTLTLTVHLLI